MKIMNLALVAVVAMTLTGVSVLAQSTQEVKWVDVTKDIMSNSAEGQGWEAEPEAKVYKDETGEFLKITSKRGDIRIDLKNKKVYHLSSDGEAEAKVASVFKRNNFMIVVKTDKVKFRATLKEEVPGVVKYLEGLSQRD